ncbi:dockerin type I repeat-containing protein [uncultured Ruminococcus sp.]|uniref:dockerin type I repeat-containing protein n=1 Tax=uncultured Ruminococcus sp. TaxID=165186 RepID=UPI0025E4E082|nr:dockerin type I repeat-containing protein [uncultured Ruminococcus sp.]
MKRKLITAILLSLIFLFFAASTVYSEAERSLSVFNDCNEYYTDNNSDGSFIYGCNFSTLYSSRILPSTSVRYVNADGIIRAVCHSGSCSYALYENKRAYFVTELNTVNGECYTYSYGNLKSIENSSFAFCDGIAYFIFTDDTYTYVRSYDSNGKALRKYTFDENVQRLVINDSKIYAQLYNGEFYRLDKSGSHYCITVNIMYDFCNAGSGYIYSEAGTLFSLSENSNEHILGTKLNCIVKSENRLIYSDDWIIEYNGKFYKSKNKIQALFFYGNNVAFLDNNLNLNTIKLSDFKESDSDLFNNYGNESRNETYKVNSDGYITGINSGTTITDFKKHFSNEVIIYDRNGNEITSGKIKTGYRTVISNVIYEISVLGDITGEGNVKSNDVSALMSHFVNKSDLSGVYLKSADFNNDGNIDNKDLVSIARKAEK